MSERPGGSFGARTWHGMIAGATTYYSVAIGILQPARSLFERCVNSKPTFFDSSYTRRVKLWPRPQIVTSFGWEPLREFWTIEGVAKIIKSGIWLYFNSYSRHISGRLLAGTALQFYAGYYIGLHGQQPYFTQETVSNLLWVCKNIGACLLYPLEGLCYRYRHNLDTAFHLSHFASPSLVPWLIRQNLHDLIAQPLYQFLLRLYYPLVHFILRREITEDRDTLKRVMGLRIFKASVVLSQQIMLCALLIPLDVIWAKALGAECEGGGSIFHVIQHTLEKEGIEGFYKGWQWYLLSNLDQVAEALFLPEVEAQDRY